MGATDSCGRGGDMSVSSSGCDMSVSGGEFLGYQVIVSLHQPSSQKTHHSQ